ncbi:MAG: DNA recombination protein RmuC [Chloroflexi bacterium]|nr:DNA recombination protein RmuC [Chloroflexota bacterium]
MELVIILLLVVLAGVLVWSTLEHRRSLEAQLHTFQRELRDGLHQTVGQRLDNTTRVVGDLRERLGELSEATKQVYQVGRDLSSLQEALRAPKPRGVMGELFLGELLAQMLPAGYYHPQHRFKNGEIADAVIRLGGGLVPVDAKFPLDNFQRLTEAATEEEQRSARRRFATDVKKHIDAVARYILPDEGTFDFAFMYIPAENVYYETIIKDNSSGEDKSLAGYALERRVVPVSPNSFYAYLQAIVLGLKGLQIEASAKEILNLLSRLQGDFNHFQKDFDTLGNHLKNARDRYDDARRKLERLGEHLLTVSHTATPQLPTAEADDHHQGQLFFEEELPGKEH